MKTHRPTWSRAWLLAILIAQMVLGPVTAFADPRPSPVDDNDPRFRPLRRLIEKVKSSREPSEPLGLPEADTDAFRLTSQHVDFSEERRFSLSSFDAGRPDPPPLSPGVAERTLVVRAVPYGVELSIGGKEKHRIHYRNGSNVVSAEWDEEFVVLLLDDGTVEVIEMASLGSLLFRAPIPVFTVGRLEQSAQGLVPRILRRRYVSPDHTRLGRETNLVADDRHLQRAVALARPETVARLAENLERVRPVRFTSRLTAARGGEAGRAGDIALAKLVGEEWVADSVLSRDQIRARIAPQITGLQALHGLANPDAAEFFKKVDRYDAETRAELEALVADEAAMHEFYVSGYQEGLARVPTKIVDQMRARADVVESIRAKAEEKKLSLRERLSIEEQREAFDRFETVVTAARERVANSGNTRFGRALSTIRRGYLRSLYAVGDAFRPENRRKAMLRVSSTLKWAAAGTAVGLVDAATTGGAGARMAVQTLASMLHWLQEQVPVLGDPAYVATDLPNSMAAQAAVMGAIFAAAALARPFVQHGVNSLISITGIRTFARLQLSPVRVALRSVGQAPAHRALREGYAGLVPYGPENRARGIARLNEKVIDGTRKRSLSAALALTAASIDAGVEPGVVAMVGTGETVMTATGTDAAMEISQHIYGAIDSATAEEISEAFADPQAFAALYQNALRAANGAKALKATNELRQTWSGWWGAIGKLRFLRAVGCFGEDTFEKLARAFPDPATANLVARCAWVDYLLTIVLQSLTGAWADPEKREQLIAQPDQLLYTHPEALVGNLELMTVYFGRSAAGLLLALGQDARRANQSYRPEAPRAASASVPGTRSVAREALSFFRHMFDLRNSRPMGYLVNYHVKAHVLLLQSSFFLGWVLRMAVAGKTPQQAAIGQTAEMACGIWSYAAIWAWLEITQANVEREVAALNERYEVAALSLREGVADYDEAKTQSGIDELRKLYDEGGMPLSRRQRAEMREDRSDETTFARAERLLLFASQHPPVPFHHREDVAAFFTAITSVISTIYYTYAYSATFAKRGIWDVDWTKLHLFGGIPAGDGPVALVALSALWTGIFYYGQLTFDALWDATRANLFPPKPGTDEEVALLERYALAKNRLATATGFKWLAGWVEGKPGTLPLACAEKLEENSGSGREPVLPTEK